MNVGRKDGRKEGWQETKKKEDFINFTINRFFYVFRYFLARLYKVQVELLYSLLRPR